MENIREWDMRVGEKLDRKKDMHLLHMFFFYILDFCNKYNVINNWNYNRYKLLYVYFTDY